MRLNHIGTGKRCSKTAFLSIGVVSFAYVQAVVAGTITDNFSGASATNNWKALDNACLTAGSGAGTIPACGTSMIASPDAAGSGALRLTTSTNNQTGAIISNFTFPTNQGLQITFATYTYGGNSGGTGADGADGISFFLQDGTTALPTTAGALGGSLGYSCSNTNSKYDGLANAYLGLGIDEYGNFLNSADNTNSGVLNTNASGGVSTYGTNTFYRNDGSHNYYQPMRIGLRGAGNTNWAALQALNSSYYNDSSPNSSKTMSACNSGQYVKTFTSTTVNGTTTQTPTTYGTIPYNYNVIAGGYRVLPNSQLIGTESATSRTNAVPITYKLTISSSGYLNFLYSYNNGAYQQVLANQLITSSNGPLPSLFRFGFSAGTGGSNNIHEITCFQASPTQSNTSVGANTVQSGQVKTNTQLYLASYTANNWYSSLISDSLMVNSSGTLVASSNANWDAGCVLTGGGCPAMGTDANGNATTTITAESPTSRVLLTWNGTQGVPLEWASTTSSTTISSAQETTLQSSDSMGQNRLGWLRGVRTNEQLQSPPGSLRARTGVLGDIIDSSPVVVGQPVAGTYPDIISDALYGGSAPETSYNQFVSNNATRTNIVYVGSNDGLLHGFRTGSYDSSGNYVSTTNDGLEVIGFMPATVLANSNVVGLTSPTYGHSYFVDATPGVGDLFYNGAWHTWLVGGLGTGGAEIYALDITTPSSFSETSPAPATQVVGDWTSATTGLSHLGNTVGTPVITRLHNGQWAVIFGNGQGNTGTAGVYIGIVNKTTGALTFQFLDTGVGSSSSPNGITYVTTADLDGDRITDYLYAGDLQGNVWRFDLTSNTASNWAVSKYGNGSATPLFVAKNSSGTVQPITTALAVDAIKTGTVYRILVYFGTGQITPLTATGPATYATGTQTFYGIWDWGLAAWPPSGGTTAGSQYAYLTGTQTISRSTLLQQSVASTTTATTAGQVSAYRNVSSTQTVCWSGSTTCTSGNNQFGFYFDLPGTQEQIIYNPVVIGSAVVVNTAIPPLISAAQCNPGLQTGFTMAFSLTNGGGLTQGFFPNSTGSYQAVNGSTVAGIQLNAVGSPTTVTYGSNLYIASQIVSGSAAVQQVNPQTPDTPHRVSWRELK